MQIRKIAYAAFVGVAAVAFVIGSAVPSEAAKKKKAAAAAPPAASARNGQHAGALRMGQSARKRAARLSATSMLAMP